MQEKSADAMAATIEELAVKKWSRTRSASEPLTAFGVFILFALCGISTDADVLTMHYLLPLLALYVTTIWTHVSRVREETFVAWSLRHTYSPQTFLQVLHQHPGLTRSFAAGLLCEAWGFRLLCFLSPLACFFRGNHVGLEFVASCSLGLVTAASILSIVGLLYRILFLWKQTTIPPEVVQYQRQVECERRIKFRQQKMARWQQTAAFATRAPPAAAAADAAHSVTSNFCHSTNANCGDEKSSHAHLHNTGAATATAAAAAPPSYSPAFLPCESGLQ